MGGLSRTQRARLDALEAKYAARRRESASRKGLALLLFFLFLLLAVALGLAETYAQTPTATPPMCLCPCTPTPTPTLTPTPTATVTPTPTATKTATPTPVLDVIFRPAAFSGALANPGIGFQTTQKPITEVSNPRNLPSTSEVFRFYAEEVNPSPGVFTWGILDNAITKAKAAGQKLNVRIIMYDPYGGSWLKGYIPGFSTRCTTEGGGTYFAPDFDSPVAQQRHRELISAFATRYNNNDTVEYVDIGSVGSYAEWHNYCQVKVPQGTALPMPQPASLRLVVKDYRDLVKKQLVGLLDDKTSREEILKYGLGWRRDCWGGHHETDLYPYWMADPDMTEEWKRAVVLLEPCGSMTSGTDPKKKVDQALAPHASAVNTKNGFTFTDAAYPEWARLLKNLGYRFVIEEVRLFGENLSMKWRNDGVAPCYSDDWLFELSFGTETRTYPACKIITGSYTTVFGPLKLPPGSYTARAAIISKKTGLPIARFANTGYDASNKLLLGTAKVP